MLNHRLGLLLLFSLNFKQLQIKNSSNQAIIRGVPYPHSKYLTREKYFHKNNWLTTFNGIATIMKDLVRQFPIHIVLFIFIDLYK